MKTKDDYQWGVYTKEYSRQIIEECGKENTLVVENYFIRNDDDIIFNDNPPIHNNWAEIYYQVLNKKVKSVFECGCGSGQHLLNIHNLYPNVEVNGCDLLSTQVEFGKKYFNLPSKVTDNIKIQSLVELDAYQKIGKTFDLTYSQAVIMHLNNDSAKAFIENMIRLSNKYIVMVEAVNVHNYREIIGNICRRLGIKYTIETTFRYIDYGILVTLEK